MPVLRLCRHGDLRRIRQATVCSVLATVALTGALAEACWSAPGSRLPTFEQGSGVILSLRPAHIDARRNVRPGSISGLDGWQVRWRSWGGDVAVATGTYFWNSPDGSSIRRYPARVRVDQRRACGTYRIYDRIRGTFTGARPPGMPRTVTLRAYPYPCGD